MKKILIIILTMTMSFMVFACKVNVNTEDGKGDKDLENLTVIYEDGETIIYLTEDGRYVDQNGNEIQFEEEETDEIGDESDFGLDVAKSYGFDKLMEKFDYSNFEGRQEFFLTNTSELTKKIFGSDFSLDVGYEEYEGDATVGVYGYENEDINQKNLEVGVYKSAEQNATIHYISYSCECLYDTSDETINKVTADLKNAMGITVNKEKLKASADRLMNATEAEMEEYYDYQVVDKDYDLYTEKASLSTVGYIDGNQHIWYIAVEMEREYK